MLWNPDLRTNLGALGTAMLSCIMQTSSTDKGVSLAKSLSSRISHFLASINKLL